MTDYVKPKFDNPIELQVDPKSYIYPHPAPKRKKPHQGLYPNLSEMGPPYSHVIQAMVDYVEFWLTKLRRPPDVEDLVRFSGLEEDHIRQLCLDHLTPFTIRLERRGLPLPTSPEVTGVNAGLRYENWLTPQQVAAVSCIANFYDKRNPQQRLEEMGISPTKFRGWLDDPAFQGYLSSRTEDSLRYHVPMMHRKVVELAESGDVRAIKLFYNLTDRIQSGPKVQINANSTTNNTNISNNDTFIKLVEAVQRHVEDPEILKAIASEFDQLTSNSSSQGGAMLPPGPVSNNQRPPLPYTTEPIEF